MVEIDDLADVVMQAIETATAPLIARIASLEKRALVHGRDGRDGKDASVDLDTLALKAAELVPTPRDGKDADTHEVQQLRTDVVAIKAAVDEQAGKWPHGGLDAWIKRFIADIPTPKDGRDGKDGKDAPPVDLDALAAKVAALIDLPLGGIEVGFKRMDESIRLDVDAKIRAAVSALPEPKNGKDGKDVDAAMLEVIVAAHVERAVAALPKPLDGKSLTPDDVAPLVQAEVGKIPPAVAGRDGVGVSGAVIDHAGVLRLTLSDGKSVECGPVRGADVDMGVVRKSIVDEVAKIPPPAAGRDGVDGQKGADGLNGKDGRDGLNGCDGLGFDDMDLFMDDEKGAIVRFKRGDRVLDFPMPWLVDRGVYVAGKRYHKGASVTAQGSIWTAQADTRARPGDGSKDWRLAVKRGRDGKDALKEPSDG